MAFNLIIFVLILLILRNIILGILSWRVSHRWKKIESKDITQRFFAEARYDLMHLMMNEELSAKSTTFRFFYHLDTFVMRRPNDYGKISALLVNSLVSDEKSNSGIVEVLMKEKKDWTPAVKDMVLKQSKALSHLMVSNSFTLRNLYRVLRVLLPFINILFSTMDVWNNWNKIKDRVGEKDKGFVHNVYVSEKTLESLAGI
jgi:hypothetical protein